MGSYLDKPETTKKSAFDENDYLEIGSSSMQGWRINQEDAHNAIPQLADNASFFAVYDGHGGSEVAEYCSMKLPDFLKQLESFKNGNYEEALKEAFMGFDSTLLSDSVVEELRQLAKKNPDYEDSDMDDMEDEETAEEIINLHQEASMPLNEVLEKYKGNVEKISRIQSVQQIINFQSKSSNKNDSEAGPSASGSCSSRSSKKVESSSSSTSQQPASDNEVSSSSSGKTNNSDENDKNEPSSSNSQPSNQTPDSTLVIIPSSSSSKNDESSSNEPKSMKPEQSSSKESVNQDSECSSNGAVSESKKDEESAISSTRENGEVGSCSSSTSATNVSSNSPKSSTAKTVTKSNEEDKEVKQKTDNDTDEDESSDDEHDETYKESPKNKIQNDSDDDEDEDDEEVYDEDDEEELSNEEISGEEDDDEDGLDDAFMSSMETGPAKASGCTAVVALLIGRDLYVANAGDSRCIVSRAGKVVEMSFDHKPEDQIEFQRIRKAGGRVTMDGRVNGGLNLSRAIGDHGYKMNKELPAEDQMITAMPDLKKITLTEEDEFMVLACDGIWNYMSNEEVVGFVKHRIDAGKLSLTQICEELFHNCLAPNTLGDGTGCDNMTAIIVKFKPTLFNLPVQKDVSSSEAECVVQKRAHEDDEVTDHMDKKQKLEDDLTPSTVDTSS